MTARRLIAILGLLVACSGGGGSGGGPGAVTAPATVAEYCPAFWVAYAERWAACAHGSEAFYRAWFDPALRCADPVQAVAAGRASYDEARAGACLGFLQSATCEALEALADGRIAQADCAGAIAGKGAEGDTCWSDASCASDLCVDASGTCPSVCLTPLSQGESCGDGWPCAPGLYCRILDMSYTCQPAAPQGTRCMQDADCAVGLQCDYGTPAPTCQPRRTSGACGDDSTCAVGYACASGACVRRLGPGEACVQGENACGDGLWCGSGGTCTAGPGPGEPCTTVNGEWRTCTAGVCRNGSCVAWTEGGTCSTSTACAPTMICQNNACTTACAEP